MSTPRHYIEEICLRLKDLSVSMKLVLRDSGAFSERGRMAMCGGERRCPLQVLQACLDFAVSLWFLFRRFSAKILPRGPPSLTTTCSPLGIIKSVISTGSPLAELRV